MNRKCLNATMAVLFVACMVGTHAWAQAPTAPPTDNDGAIRASSDQPEGDAPELASVVLSRAAKADKYVFVFVYRTDDEPTQAARKTLESAMEKFADRAVSTTVNVADPLERAFVNKNGLGRVPMPIVLAFAPNGAVTRGFPTQFTAEQLESAFVSPNMQKCLKALQDRKMVFVCVQNGTTQHNAEAMQGVNEFAAEAQYAKKTEIVTVDPTDAAEESLLKQFKVDPKTDEAVTVFLAPPGTTVGTYKGVTEKAVLVAAAKTASKGCTPGGSCCPAPKKPGEAKPATPEKKNP